ncbi:hypothetical protein AMTR_s00134p00119180 [Amborella trichopoda]|uniref:Uncharacterized protein n=1 Tax=Amborella trichopoda TaxID=13333 RepID=W1P7M5_AMBTC|nr:hypothetical protein AMTR_s00134p00119180 [Amborella trichopoda]
MVVPLSSIPVEEAIEENAALTVSNNPIRSVLLLHDTPMSGGIVATLDDTAKEDDSLRIMLDDLGLDYTFQSLWSCKLIKTISELRRPLGRKLRRKQGR